MQSFTDLMRGQSQVVDAAGHGVARGQDSKKELELLALEEIRSLPGGQFVIAVELECEDEQLASVDPIGS
ncbi:hypothetical protein [Bradyrhizobium japonicum]|uniref:hypothetical protein n=1 Tax=Bradyrhizobium japonicum TaxID=375 RepID=UPI0027144EC3|nr:hypothetical protein [Bradyrhizobium japonicum]WLB24080.1 hypothetical protein QIH95_50025 [Bradyrhizobium japonicum]